MARKIPEESLIDKKQTAKFKPTDLKVFEPLTENQRLFFEAYDRGDYFVMLTGSAGTGKSFIAMYKGIQEVLSREKSFNKIVIVRSAVQSRDLGFTPGSVEEKMSLYEQPYMQIMTRVGYRSKIIFCGDYRQTDLYRKNSDKSGLGKFHRIAKMMNAFTNIEFTTDDIVRSSLVKDFLVAVDKFEKENNC